MKKVLLSIIFLTTVFNVANCQTCSGWYVSPTSTTLSASSSSGNTFNVWVTNGTSCTYSKVSNNPSWITNLGGSGSTVSYSVSANTGAARTGSISIKNINNTTVATYIINQNASCTSPSNGSISPSSPTVTAPNNINLTVSTSGTAPFSYQWYYWAGSSWFPLSNSSPYSGATNQTLTIGPTATGFTGNQYTCVVSNSCGTQNNIPSVQLTVNPACTPISSTYTISNQTVTAPAPANFSVSASGSSITYQWQYSTNNGSTWNNVPNSSLYSGSTSSSLTVNSTSLSMDGYLYRCSLFNNCTSIGYTNWATLNVNNNCSNFSSSPHICFISENDDSLTVTVGQTWTKTWQLRNAGTSCTALNSTCTASNYYLTINSMTRNGVTVASPSTYLDSFSGPFFTILPNQMANAQTTSTFNQSGTYHITYDMHFTNGQILPNLVVGGLAATVTVNPVCVPPSNGTISPSSPNVTAPNSISLSVSANGTPPFTYQWYGSSGGSGWFALANSTPYSGAFGPTLTIGPTATGFNGNLYKCEVSNGCGSQTNIPSVQLNVNSSCSTPGVPQNTVGSPSGQTSANLSWAAGSPAGSSTITYYWVVGTSSSVVYNGSGVVAQGITNGTTMNDIATGLTCGIPYYLRVYSHTDCGSGSNSSYSTSPSFIITCGCTPPSTPSTPTPNTPVSGPVTLTRGNPPSGVTWYWQGTNSNGTSTANSNSTYSATSTGVYYLRAFNGSCWSASSASISVVVNTQCSITASMTLSSTSIPQGGVKPKVTFTGSGGTPPYTFSFKVNSGATQTISSGTSSYVDYEVNTSTIGNLTFNLMGVQDGNCSSNLNQNITCYVTNPSQTIFYNSNSTLPGNPKVVSSGFSNNNPNHLKICADGSISTFVEYYNNDPNQAMSSIGFRVKFFDGVNYVYPNDPVVYGEFTNVTTLGGPNSNVRKAFLHHPDVLSIQGSSFRSEVMEIYNTITGAPIVEYPLRIYRAPLLCVHGLWGNQTTFKDFTDYLLFTGIYPGDATLDYSPIIHRMTYPNAASFSDNRFAVKNGIEDLVRKAILNNYSCGKVDLICHSMGGVMARLYIQNPYNINNFYRNNVHKLITANTPHSGSQFADYAYNSFNSSGLLLLLNYYMKGNTNSTVQVPSIMDLRVDGDGVMDNLLNGLSLVNSNLVPTFAITTKTESNFNDIDCNWLTEYIAPVIFDGQENDVIVEVASQQGGINCPPSLSSNCPKHNYICHMKSVQDPTLKLILKEKLEQLPSSSYFDVDGFTPPNLSYNYYPYNFPSNAPSSAVHITYPLNNSIYAPGDTINIHVSGSSNLSKIALTVGSGTIEPTTYSNLGNNLVLNFTIPVSAYGILKLIAFGHNSSNPIVHDIKNIYVNPLSSLDSIKIDPPELYIHQFQKGQFEIIGYFQDGVKRTLTNSSTITYWINDTNIVTIDSFQFLNGKNSGITSLNVSLGNLSNTAILNVISDTNYQYCGFIADKTTSCVNEVYNFTNYTTGGYLSLYWDFPGGNPSTSNAENPLVSYDSPGTYSVRLIANFPGKSDTLLMTNYIHVSPNPNLAITANPSTICQGNSTTLSASGASSYLWEPTYDTTQIIIPSPITTTIYTVIGTDMNGCSATSTAIVSVNQPTYSTDNVTACNTYTWPINGQTYTSSGVYSAISTNPSGCAHTATLNLTIENNTSSSLSVTTCGAYTWVGGTGLTYNVPGTYIDTTTLPSGCLKIDSLIILSPTIAQQTLQWLWIHGSNSTDQLGVYGIKSVPTNTNTPGARDGAMSCSDAQGNLWLFGGWGKDKFGNYGMLNDLWKFNTVSKQWTWISGDSVGNQYGIYGTMGISSNLNKPGGRTFGVGWFDNNGNIWIFGGSGYGEGVYINGNGDLGDLWKYNINSGLWTWMKGFKEVNQSGVYGSKGTPSSTNMPGCRQAAMGCSDNSGNLWLFGAVQGSDINSNQGLLNDLWKFNINTGMWTWVSGDNIINQYGIYGTKNVSSIFNKPGSRGLGICSIDNMNNIWIYSGTGAASNDIHELNDLWKYNTTTNQWTWISGDKFIDQPGVYGTKGISSINNKPGARHSSTGGFDNNNNFIIFGGYTSSSLNPGGFLNDYWAFNVSTGQWTWYYGNSYANSYGIYGTQGEASNVNMPGAREWTTSWFASNSLFYLYGGYGYGATGTYGDLNDLWVLTPPCPLNISTKLIIQGYYISNEKMNPVLKLSGIGNSMSNCDTVTIELHSSTSPYQLLASSKSVLRTDGYLVSSFSYSPGNYYIVVKPRNGVETWSSSPIQVNDNTFYNFSDSANKAFGDNQVQVEPNVWAIYSGDINHDEAVDAFDYLEQDISISLGLNGYQMTDLNGDGAVDAFDYLILDPNIVIGVGVNKP
jgi:pimeloyl-ACP methyl ester carboxylesterase